MSPRASRALVAVALLVLSATVLYQQETDGHSVPPRFEVLRHLEWMEGRSELFNPWQYRVLPDLLLEGTIRVFGAVPAWRERAIVRHRPNAAPNARIAANRWALAPYYTLRVMLVAGVFAAWIAWSRRLGVEDARLQALGVSLLAYAMGQAHFDSGMAYGSYFDTLFYLLAALAITAGRATWVLPLSVLAALNRETGALIPVLLGVTALAWPGPRVEDRRALAWAGASLAAFAAVFVAVRSFYGWQSPSPVYDNQGVADFLSFNFTNRYTLPELLGSFGLLPILGVFTWKRWPPLLRRWFWCVVPLWLAVHLSFGLLRETRLLLVPYSLILLPGLLLPFAKPRSPRETLSC